MGMIANYQQTTDKKLNELKSHEEMFEDIEELQENENLDLCDIDKMWDALHFLLTGKSASEPIENDLISEAIVGQFNISGEEIEEYISGTRADRVKEIAVALQKVDFEKYIPPTEKNYANGVFSCIIFTLCFNFRLEHNTGKMIFLFRIS